MSVSLKTITKDLDQLLQPESFKDYCPNGLQVEGKTDVEKVISGVTASQALIDAAVDEQADLILVHHGYFWRGENPAIVGMKRRRIQTLLTNGISLLAYHLPLDAHPTLGNNVQLGKLLGFQSMHGAGHEGDAALVMTGKLAAPMGFAEFNQRLGEKLEREPMGIQGGESRIETVAWCTGGGQGFIDIAIAAGADAYISGEISEQTTHSARENGIHFFAAGHHATERYGVQAVGAYLAEKYKLQHRFIDMDNPA